MFKPPFCPHRDCTNHKPADAKFYTRFGTYIALCRPRPVPRFRCKACKRTFSRQTFRADYWDQKPHLNVPLFELLSAGVGLRESARTLGLSLRATELKARKIARQARQLNLNLQDKLPKSSSLQFDELETYEGRRNTRPLTLPVLIEASSRVIIWAESATIRPRGKMTQRRLRAIAADEKRYGPRKDRSISAIRRTLARAVPLVQDQASLLIDTDKKMIYPSLIAQAFKGLRIIHRRTSSFLERDTDNPLFPINQTEAVMRDLTGRLRRESWLVSKRRRWLDVALHIFIAKRNLVRPRFNKDKSSPAQLVGWVKRRLTVGEVLSWRQCFGGRSMHPLSRKGRLIGAMQAAG